MGIIKMEFKLKEVRESKGLTQYQLARMCDLTVNTISNYERGTKRQYSHDLLEKFCEVLQCEPGELFVLVQDNQAA